MQHAETLWIERNWKKYRTSTSYVENMQFLNSLIEFLDFRFFLLKKKLILKLKKNYKF